MYDLRLQKARAQMKERGIDLLMLTHSSDLFYLTGIRLVGPWGMIMEKLTCLCLSADEAHFIAPRGEVEGLPEEAARLLEGHGWVYGEDPFSIATGLLPERDRRGTIAVGRETPTWVLLEMQQRMSHASWTAADPMMTAMRSVKDEYEYKVLKRVQEKSCRALERVWEHGVAGLTELEVSNLLSEYCLEEGVDCPGGGVASGPNGAHAHHMPTDRVIEVGDVLTIDFGGEEPGVGYQSDTTRTVAVGRIADGLQEVYDVVREANQAVFEAAKPGVPCGEMDRLAMSIIETAGYGESFTHRVGHGIGIDVHEQPALAWGNTQLLQVGNTVSDEPGIYLPGRFGVRTEDQLFIREDGAERLTPLGHDLLIVD